MRLISVLIGFLWLWKAAEEERKVCDRLSAALVTHKACFEKASAIAEKLSVSLTFHLEKKIMVRFTIGGTTKQVLGVTIYSACSARIPSKPGPYRMGKFAISITLRQSTLRYVGLFSCSSHSLILEKKTFRFVLEMFFCDLTRFISICFFVWKWIPEIQPIVLTAAVLIRARLIRSNTFPVSEIRHYWITID